MKRTIDGRSLVSYGLIATIGLFLFALLSPNLGGYFSFHLYVLVLRLLPIIAIAVILIYLWGNTIRSTKSYSRKTTKMIAITAVACIFLSVIITYLSSRQPFYDPHTLRYIFANIGDGFTYFGFAATLLVINIQKFVYWPFWNRSDKINSDERQIAVRQRVFEKAYRLNLLILLVAPVLYINNGRRMSEQVIEVIVLCLLGSPALIAAWQKDS